MGYRPIGAAAKVRGLSTPRQSGACASADMIDKGRATPPDGGIDVNRSSPPPIRRRRQCGSMTTTRLTLAIRSTARPPSPLASLPGLIRLPTKGTNQLQIDTAVSSCACLAGGQKAQRRPPTCRVERN